MPVLDHIEKISATFAASEQTKDVTLTTTLTDTSKALLFFGARHASNTPDCGHVSGQIINTTTVRFQRPASGCTTGASVVGYVVEWSSGVVVERGSTTFTSNQMDIALSNITDLSKSFVLCSGREPGTGFSSDDAIEAWLWDNAGTPTLSLKGYTTMNGTAEWQVCQYDACSVQRGHVDLVSATSASATLGTSVNLSKSFLIVNPGVGSFFSNTWPTSFCIRGRFINSSTVEFDRVSNTSGVTTHIRWEVVEFTDGTSVQEKLVSVVGGTTQTDTTITSVSNGVAFASVKMREGKAFYTGDDYAGEGWATFDLTSPTNLRTVRDRSGDDADFAVYVVDFDPGTAPPSVVPQRTLIGVGVQMLLLLFKGNNVPIAWGPDSSLSTIWTEETPATAAWTATSSLSSSWSEESSQTNTWTEEESRSDSWT